MESADDGGCVVCLCLEIVSFKSSPVHLEIEAADVPLLDKSIVGDGKERLQEQ